MPPGIDDVQEGLEHRRLEPVEEAWTYAGEVPEAQVGAERNTDRDEHFETRADQRGLDPGQVGVMDPDDRGQLAEGQARVESQPADLLTDPEVQAPKSTSGFALHEEPRHGHPPVKHVPLIRLFTGCHWPVDDIPAPWSTPA